MLEFNMYVDKCWGVVDARDRLRLVPAGIQKPQIGHKRSPRQGPVKLFYQHPKSFSAAYRAFSVGATGPVRSGCKRGTGPVRSGCGLRPGQRCSMNLSTLLMRTNSRVPIRSLGVQVVAN